MSLLDDTGVLNLTHNWFKPGYVNSFSAMTGTINNDGTSVTGSSPGFLNEAGQDYHLTAGSSCINGGTSLHPNTVTANNVVRQYVKHQAGQDRVVSGALDIGAYEQNPTAITLMSCKATAYANGVVLEWQTGYEVSNLGFNLYRVENGKRALVNPQLIAGSALTTSSALSAGQSYRFLDAKHFIGQSTEYWLEDIDLNGQPTWNGPFYAEQAREKELQSKADSLLLAQLSNSDSLQNKSRVVEPKAELSLISQSRSQNLFALPSPSSVNLAAQSAIKIGVRQAGWYRLSQSELLTVGLAAKINPRNLQLYVDGKEIAIAVSGEEDNRFDAEDYLEFYGLGLDTPSTDTRIYWLIAGNTPGKRISKMPSIKGSHLNESFACTVERRDHNIYFAALKNGDADNFFGAVVTANPVAQTIHLLNLNQAITQAAIIEIALQGVTEQAHQVSVNVHGRLLGYVNFNGQERGVGHFRIPPALLREGDNLITLQSQRGTSDVSLVEAIRLTYQHTFRADDDQLNFTAQAGEMVTISGFSTKDVRVFDVTDANAVQELTAKVSEESSKAKSSFAATVTVTGAGERQLLALSEAKARNVASLNLNHPSNLRQTGNTADFLIISPAPLLNSLRPLAEYRSVQGLLTMLVDVEDIYDEFSFGNKSPQAIKDFLRFAKSSWQVKPRFVMLAGDASYDARNYLGGGDNDLIPTKLLETSYLETASDDWFVDFDNDGIAEMSLGRLPVRNAEETAFLVRKIIAYDQSPSTDKVLLVADRNDSFDFEWASRNLQSLLPPSIKAESLWRSRMDETTAHEQLLRAINSGQQIVNYTGHGSMTAWRDNWLTTGDAQFMTNAEKPSLFVLMTCLNGYFHDAMNDSLSEALLKAERGAIAVWASSALCLPQEQAALNQALYRIVFADRGIRLGDAIRQAKAEVNDLDVRRSWILLGDPSMKL